MLENIKAPKILIVEDDRDTREIVVDTLVDEGYLLEEASDGVSGLEKIAEFQPAIVLLDVMMPDLDGIELCRRIRANPETSAITVLMLTAKDDPSEKIKGFKAGADDYITKPFVIGELIARIKAHLRIQTLKYSLGLSEERYRLLIENSPSAILLFSTKFELLYYNSKFIQLLHGRTTEPLTGRTLQSLFPVSELFRELSSVLEEVVRSNRLMTRDVVLAASNHENLSLEIHGMPVKLKQSLIGMYQIVINDLTQRRKMEEALIQAEKINSLGILTAGIAHEVNNPLTGISSAIQILKSKSVTPEKKDDLCDAILSHIDRIARIIKELNIFSRPQGVTGELFSLYTAVSEALSISKYQTEDRIELELVQKDENLFIFGDRNQFQQVIINLALNAIQAIKEKGVIITTLSRIGSNAVITMEDSGCGIPTDQLSRVFDPFYTTKRDWKGTGLGLAVSYRILQLFKGSITVESTVGKGSRFIVTVPLRKKPF